MVWDCTKCGTQFDNYGPITTDRIYADILFKYIARLNDPVDSDPLDKIVKELLDEINGVP